LNPDAEGFYLREVVQNNRELQKVLDDFNSDEIEMIMKKLKE
jgi:hypothetical protein